MRFLLKFLLGASVHGGALPSDAAAGEDAACTVCLENVHGIGCHVDER